jgi:hypothetical protein
MLGAEEFWRIGARSRAGSVTIVERVDKQVGDSRFPTGWKR